MDGHDRLEDAGLDRSPLFAKGPHETIEEPRRQPDPAGDSIVEENGGVESRLLLVSP